MPIHPLVLVDDPVLYAGLQRYTDEHDLPWRVYLLERVERELEVNLPSVIDGAVLLRSLNLRRHPCFGPRIPLVQCQFDGGVNNDFTVIGVDDQAIGSLAAQHLVEVGFRHLACVGAANIPVIGRRFQAFHAACQRLGVPCNTVSMGDQAGDTALERERAAIRLLRRVSEPVGLFFHQDQSAASFFRLCLRHNLRVPQDFGIVGVDDGAICTKMGISSVVVPWTWIGYQAGRELHRLFSGQPPRREPILVPPLRVVTRASTRIEVHTGDPAVDALIGSCVHAQKPVVVSDLLTATGLSQSTFWRRCRTHLRMSPQTYIMRRRLEAAQKSLHESDESIAGIAKRLGFGTARSLQIQFRRAFGLSPSQFRFRIRLQKK